MNPLPENTCRRFLLGIASEEEQSLVEDAVLADELDASFLLHAEDGLIDDYLLGSLTREEQNRFKTHFLSTEERRQRHAFASALMEYARKQPAEEHSVGRTFLHRSIRAVLSWRQAALLGAAASVLLAVLAGFQQLQLRRQGQIASEARNELTRLRAEIDSGAAELLSLVDRPRTLSATRKSRRIRCRRSNSRSPLAVCIRPHSVSRPCTIRPDQRKAINAFSNKVSRGAGRIEMASTSGRRSFLLRSLRQRRRAPLFCRHPFCRREHIISSSKQLPPDDQLRSRRTGCSWWRRNRVELIS